MHESVLWTLTPPVSAAISFLWMTSVDGSDGPFVTEVSAGSQQSRLCAHDERTALEHSMYFVTMQRRYHKLAIHYLVASL
jgi:hypothetical protein